MAIPASYTEKVGTLEHSAQLGRQRQLNQAGHNVCVPIFLRGAVKCQEKGMRG